MAFCCMIEKKEGDMFTSAKDIMKIIWNGLREIKKNCSDYYEKDARKDL